MQITAQLTVTIEAGGRSVVVPVFVQPHSDQKCLTYIESYDHGEAQVIILASMITLFNLLFIVFMVPESLQDRKATWGTSITWEQADPLLITT